MLPVFVSLWNWLKSRNPFKRKIAEPKTSPIADLFGVILDDAQTKKRRPRRKKAK